MLVQQRAVQRPAVQCTDALRVRRRQQRNTAPGCKADRRSRIIQQAAFCPPVMTSVFAPTSNCGVRFCTAAISPRSSISEIRSPWSDSRRTHSRSSVVFPPPGGERMSVLQKPSFISCGTSASAHPGTACGMRTDTELSCRMPSI